MISIAILALSLACAYYRPDRRWWLTIAGMYALIDVTFYMIILVFGVRSLGNELSPYRAAMQDAIILAVLVWYMRGNFGDWLKQWK